MKTLSYLIVDGDTGERASIEDYLNQLPEIELAGSFGSIAQTLEQIEQQIPDLIFLDVHLTDGTGFDLLKHFPCPPPFEVAFVTESEDHRKQAFDCRCIDYISKPVKIGELQRAIERTQITRAGLEAIKNANDRTGWG